MRAAFFATLLTFATTCLAAAAPVKRQDGSESAQVVVYLNSTLNNEVPALNSAVNTFANDGKTADQVSVIQSAILAVAAKFATVGGQAFNANGTFTEKQADNVNTLLKAINAGLATALGGLEAQEPAIAALGSTTVADTEEDLNILESLAEGFATDLVDALPADTRPEASFLTAAIVANIASADATFKA